MSCCHGNSAAALRCCLSAAQRAQRGADVPEGSFKVGERVMALLAGGGYAEEVRLPGAL